MAQDDQFKAFFRSRDPGIQFEEEPEPVEEPVAAKPLEGEELDSLVGEIGIERKDGESDIDLRERAALEALESNPLKSLEMVLGKRQADWHPDEGLLLQAFKIEGEQDKKQKFIHDYLHREEVTQDNEKLAKQHHVMYPQFCVLSNELRELMSWFLGTVAPWDRDPCFGCSYCMMGKQPEE